MTGCATTGEPEKVSEQPWNSPQTWEKPSETEGWNHLLIELLNWAAGVYDR